MPNCILVSEDPDYRSVLRARLKVLSSEIGEPFRLLDGLEVIAGERLPSVVFVDARCSSAMSVQEVDERSVEETAILLVSDSAFDWFEQRGCNFHIDAFLSFEAPQAVFERAVLTALRMRNRQYRKQVDASFEALIEQMHQHWQQHHANVRSFL